MKTIKATSQKGRQMKAAYLGAQFTELYQVYNKHSTEKEIAYIYCKSCYYAENGKRFRITSWNTFKFTCGWTTKEGIRIETRENSYLIVED